MIQKILDTVANLEGSYTDVVETEKILKMLLLFMIVDRIFDIQKNDEGFTVKQDGSVFLNYLNEQLDLYVEDKDVKLFLFSTITMMYFMDSQRIMQSPQIEILISQNDGTLYQQIREGIRPQLVEELRKTELFFKGVENEKV